MSLSQTEKLYSLLSDNNAHRTDEILREVYGGDHLGLARLAARIYDVKKKYGVTIEGWKDDVNPALYWYQISVTTNVFKEPDKELVEKYPALFVQKVEEEVKQGTLL